MIAIDDRQLVTGIGKTGKTVEYLRLVETEDFALDDKRPEQQRGPTKARMENEADWPCLQGSAVEVLDRHPLLVPAPLIGEELMFIHFVAGKPDKQHFFARLIDLMGEPFRI